MLAMSASSVKNHRNPYLNPVMARILRAMKADALDPEGYDGYLTHTGRSWVVGLDSVSGNAAMRLLQLAAVRRCEFGAGAEYYEVSAEGEHLLADPAYVPAIVAVQEAGARSVVINSDGSKILEF